MEEKNKELPLEKETIMHSMNQQRLTALFSPVVLLFLAAAVIAGIGTGYVLGQRGLLGTSSTTTTSATGNTVVGSNDTKTFKDIAEGVLQEGGIDGEGQYHLVRPGGENQYVYLTSSTVDLSAFLKKKVKVWGETQKAQKAGWLMDVGRVEMLR